MRINITKDHVNKAINAYSDHGPNAKPIADVCPVSQCLREMFPSAKDVVTGYDALAIDDMEYTISPTLSAVIKNFDANLIFPIGEYEISLKGKIT